MKMTLELALCALALPLLVGCSAMKPEKPDAGEAQAPRDPAEVSKLTPEALLLGSAQSALTDEQKNIVVARIGDDEITLGELERRLNAQPTYVRVRYNALDKKKEFLDDLIRFELLAREARAKGYDRDPDVVFTMKQEMIKKLLTEDVQELVQMSDVTDAEVQAYYEQNKALYQKDEMVRVSQVVLDDLEKARNIRVELARAFELDARKTRQLFADAVRNHSVDEASKAQGGDLRFFDREGNLEDGSGTVPAAVAEAAFALTEINGLSPLVEVDGTWRILMLTNRRPAVDKALADVERQIRNKLFRDKKDQAREGYIDSLKAKTQVVVKEEVLALIKNPDVQPEPGEENPPMPGADHVRRLGQELDRQLEEGAIEAHPTPEEHE
jgi:parvulin-like peptidyl-prolyl isomerase